jgi:ABC-type dipeptide/oligopeptide/nickel transport system permease component
MGTLTAIAADLGITGSLANIIGGIIGIVLFTYLGGFIQEYLVATFPKKFGKKFSSSTRFLVKVKQRFGLTGIAAITPIFLSIPVGVIFALALTHDKKKIMTAMFLSMFFWAILLFLPYFLFDISVMDLVRQLFER